MSGIITKYDAFQHCIASKSPQGKMVAMDCPYTGKGEEMSPTNLVKAAIAGCMLMAMGALAVRNEIDLSGTTMDVQISGRDTTPHKFKSIDIDVSMSGNISETDRVKLEKAAETCPIKHSFDSEVQISVRYNYPD